MVFSREGPKVSDVRRRAPSRARYIDVSRPMLISRKYLGKELVQSVRIKLRKYKNPGNFYCSDFVDLKDEIIWEMQHYVKRKKKRKIGSY